MRISRRPLTVALLLTVALPASATMLRQMSLSDLASRADRIYRGRVVGIDTTTIHAGGSDLPVTVYRLKVVEKFKGTFDAPKGEAVVELRMLSSKGEVTWGSQRSFSALRDIPQLQMGAEYVLFTTPPSAIGLSTTVGLGQGAFTIQSGTKEELVSNAYSNAGLRQGPTTEALPHAGAVPYARFARAVRDVLPQVRP